MNAVELAWKEYAEACCEHDVELGRHACSELRRLIPEQRAVQPDSNTPPQPR